MARHFNQQQCRCKTRAIILGLNAYQGLTSKAAITGREEKGGVMSQEENLDLETEPVMAGP